MPRKAKKRGPTWPLHTSQSHIDRQKPKRFMHYLTIGELARRVNKDVKWLKKLEKRGTIPEETTRHKLGKLEIRLYSPERVAEIERILPTLKPGRPRKQGG